MSAGDTASGFQTAKPAWRPRREAVATMEELRHADMVSLRNRIADLTRAPSADWLYQAGLILTGLAVATAVSGLWMLQKGPTSVVLKAIYWPITAALFVFAVFAFLAYRTADRQRGDSLEAILHRFDELLAAYEFVDAPISATSPAFGEKA